MLCGANLQMKRLCLQHGWKDKYLHAFRGASCDGLETNPQHAFNLSVCIKMLCRPCDSLHLDSRFAFPFRQFGKQYTVRPFWQFASQSSVSKLGICLHKNIFRIMHQSHPQKKSTKYK